MIVYAAMYNPCIYESEPEILSLHLNREKAQGVVDRKKRKEERIRMTKPGTSKTP